MKILVVSLLRLGDILLATSVLRSLRNEHPEAEIHILINGQFRSVTSMIPFVSKVFSFDRERIQEIIGTPERSILEAYFRVEGLVEKLKSECYDRVINLTHNRLSGWLTALLDCPDTKGVIYGPQGKSSAGSEWFNYLNDFTEPGLGNAFHFVDIFHYGSCTESKDRRIELVETPNGIHFAKKALTSFVKKKIVVIQPFSAEAKKTFKVSKWKEICKILKAIEPQIEIFVLGSHAESSQVDEICQSENIVGLACELDEAFSVLTRADLLITNDTSIKHLASATKIKILEISLGSSEYLRTGAYKDGAVIIQARVPCAPCSHRTGCTQLSHLCSEKISPDLVAMTASTILRHDEKALRFLAQEDSDDVIIAKTTVNASGDWAAYPLAQIFNSKEISNWIDRASFKLYLQGEHKKGIGLFGSEGLYLKKLLEDIFPDRASLEWMNELKNLESEVESFENKVEDFLGRLKKILGSLDVPEVLDNFLIEVEQFCETTKGSTFSSYGHQIAWSIRDPKMNVGQFETVRKLRERLSCAHQRTKIELRLIRGLQTVFKEA